MSFTKIKITKRQSGFTIIELIIVIVIIAILATISSISYEKILGNVRNSQRASNAKVLAEALEKYYDQNGQYPSCTTMTNSNLSVVSAALNNVNKNVLTAPLADSGVNSITCVSVTDTEDDVVYYTNDKSTDCKTGSFCMTFSLKYRDELTGDIITIAGKHKAIATGGYIVNFGSTGDEWLYSGTELNDGNYVAVGVTNTDTLTHGANDMMIVKYSPSGETIWTKAWGGPSGEYASSIVGATDGGFVVIGTTDSYGVSNSDIFITKYSTLGVIEWSKVWGGAQYDGAGGIARSGDGGYVITGTSTSFGNGNESIIAKFSATGTLSWSKAFGGAANESAVAVIRDSDGNFVVSGNTTSYTSEVNSDVFLSKFDSSGNQLWTKTWGGEASDSIGGVTQLSNGDYVMSGTSYNGSFGLTIEETFVARFTKDGSFVSNKILGSTEYNYGYGIASTTDGGYVITGEIDSDAHNGDVYAIKFDSNDSLLFSKTWGSTGYDAGYAIIQNSDQTITVIGDTYYKTAGSDDGMIMVLDKNGGIKNCDATCVDKDLAEVNPTATITSNTFTVSDISSTVVCASEFGSLSDITVTRTSLFE